jgi:hypothetical protein
MDGMTCQALGVFPYGSLACDVDAPHDGLMHYHRERAVWWGHTDGGEVMMAPDFGG